MNTFTNKVVVITGGNSGIGLATAKKLRHHLRLVAEKRAAMTTL